MIQNNNYYAFGLQTSDSWTRVDTKPNQYLYNQASELNSNTGLYETPLRGYDPALGRFQGVDIMADMYSGFTPYQYADNQPVNKNDPTGAYADDNWWNAPRGLWGGRGDPGLWREQQRLTAYSRDKSYISDTQVSFFAKAGTLGFNYDSFMFGGHWETQETSIWVSNPSSVDPDAGHFEHTKAKVFVADPPQAQVFDNFEAAWPEMRKQAAESERMVMGFILDDGRTVALPQAGYAYKRNRETNEYVENTSDEYNPDTLPNKLTRKGYFLKIEGNWERADGMVLAGVEGTPHRQFNEPISVFGIVLRYWMKDAADLKVNNLILIYPSRSGSYFTPYRSLDHEKILIK